MLLRNTVSCAWLLRGKRWCPRGEADAVGTEGFGGRETEGLRASAPNKTNPRSFLEGRVAYGRGPIPGSSLGLWQCGATLEPCGALPGLAASVGVAPGLCTWWSPSLHPPLSSLSQQLPLLLLVSFPGEAFPDPQASSQGPCPTLGALSSPPLWRLPSCNFSLQCHIISRPHPALACLVYSPTSLGSSSQKLNFSAC